MASLLNSPPWTVDHSDVVYNTEPFQAGSSKILLILLANFISGMRGLYIR